MLLSAVSVLVVAQSSSEIPEGLMNNPVYIANGISKASSEKLVTYLPNNRPTTTVLQHVRNIFPKQNLILNFLDSQLSTGNTSFFTLSQSRETLWPREGGMTACWHTTLDCSHQWRRCKCMHISTAIFLFDQPISIWITDWPEHNHGELLFKWKSKTNLENLLVHVDSSSRSNHFRPIL